jgi:hypothetical protein
MATLGEGAVRKDRNSSRKKRLERQGGVFKIQFE